MSRSAHAVPAALLLALLIVPAPSAGGQANPLSDGRETAYSSSDPGLNGLGAHLRATLEANRKEFAGRTGTVKGFGAGTLYPQVWLRDSATLIPLSRYHYPLEYLTSWLQEHLAHQRSDGELHDWIAPGNPERFRDNAPRAAEVYRGGGIVVCADRNTTETDQESSAVDAAWQVFACTGDRGWLLAPVAGRSLIDRLDAALASVIAKRFSPRYGLVTSGYTADWGDVSPVHADQRVIYLDEGTPVVVALYTNVLFFRAAQDLADLHRSLGRHERARYWSGQAELVRRNMTRHLWQEGRGFYRSHRLAEGHGGAADFDDSDLFALGGNGLAALYGVAEAKQAERIFTVAAERQRRFGVSTIAGVLLPPYPRGFFKHPILQDEYVYQNGGQWDWFAGRFLLAEFERGHAERARQQLQDVAARILASGGLYEWYTREGQGRGSATYAGSAGALGAAVFQGLFGIDLRAGRLDLRVRLGSQSGEVRVREPGTGQRVAYRYRFDGKARAVRLAYESGARGTGSVAILLPVGATATRVRLDASPGPYRMESVGRDRYVVVSTDWMPHDLEVRFR